MRLHRSALACLAAVAALTLVAADAAWAQKTSTAAERRNIGAAGPRAPMRGGGYRGGGYQGGGHRGGGWGVGIPGVLLTIPRMAPPDEVYRRRRSTTTTTCRSGGRGSARTRRTTKHRVSGQWRRQVPDEVVIEVPNSATAQQIDALQRRHRLTRIESQTFQLSGTTLYRWRIPDRRSVAAVVRALEADRLVAVGAAELFVRAARATRPRAQATRAQAIRRNTNSPSCICRRRMRSPRATTCWWR